MFYKLTLTPNTTILRKLMLLLKGLKDVRWHHVYVIIYMYIVYNTLMPWECMIYHLWVVQYVLSHNVPGLQHHLISKEVQHTMKVSSS